MGRFWKRHSFLEAAPSFPFPFLLAAIHPGQGTHPAMNGNPCMLRKFVALELLAHICGCSTADNADQVRWCLRLSYAKNVYLLLMATLTLSF